MYYRQVEAYRINWNETQCRGGLDTRSQRVNNIFQECRASSCSKTETADPAQRSGSSRDRSRNVIVIVIVTVISHSPEIVVVQVQPGDGHIQLLEVVLRYIPQIRVRHPQGDLLLGGEFAV